MDMKFLLEGILKFSRPLDFFEVDFPEMVAREINAKLFRKGVPSQQEGSRITHWTINGMKLFLTIEGTTYLRPHDALLRLRKYLAEFLGKNYNIGVRELLVKRYEIRFKPEKMPKKPIEVKVPWVESIELRGNEIVVKLQDLDAKALEDRYVERILRRINEKIELQLYGGKAEHWELIWRSKRRKPIWNKDPTPEMEKRGWIKRFSVGVWWHGPVSAKIMRTMERIAVDELIKPLKFQEVILPKTVPLEVWKRTGHVPGSSNAFFYVSRPEKLDPAFWEDFADYVKVTNRIPYDLLKQKLANPTAGICFAQCPPLYWFFENKLIPESELPLKFWDASGVSYRWEGGGLHGIERDCEFHRIEIVWMGTKEQAIKIKEQILERYKYIFNEILELEWRMARVTPWYMAQAGILGTPEEKELGTIDFEAWLPWRGPRDKSEWLEFQNLTLDGTKFSDAWNFKTDKGNEIWTGCTGIGLERWMCAFLSQKGLNPEKWPKKFLKKFGKWPKEIKLE